MRALQGLYLSIGTGMISSSFQLPKRSHTLQFHCCLSHRLLSQSISDSIGRSPRVCNPLGNELLMLLSSFCMYIIIAPNPECSCRYYSSKQHNQTPIHPCCSMLKSIHPHSSIPCRHDAAKTQGGNPFSSKDRVAVALSGESAT